MTRKDHFPLPFMDQLLERISGQPFYCFLDGYSGCFQIEIAVEDQEKTTFTCPFGTYAYRRMPIGLCDAPAPRRYHTRVSPTPPAPSHPRPACRAPSSNRARTSSPRESSMSRPMEPQSPPHQRIARVAHLDLSPASMIRRPYFPYNPIPGNADCSERDLHAEVYYDPPDYSQDPELRDSMLLVQKYSLEPFMTPHQFFYPRVVIEFYHTMTSRRKPNPTALHFSIDGRPGLLRASDITATFNLPVVLDNSEAYKQWSHPSPREMVHLLSGDTTAGTILFRRQLQPCMRLIDHILRSNLFPLQHIVQRR